MKIVLEPKDFVEIREMLMGNVDQEFTDEQLITAVMADGYIVGVVVDGYGWNDTEVRDRLCSSLEGQRESRQP